MKASSCALALNAGAGGKLDLKGPKRLGIEKAGKVRAGVRRTSIQQVVK
jgi:hypothetical protein